MQNIIKIINASSAECKDALAEMPELDFTDVIKDAIRAFVGENYGTSELNNPSWDIGALATAINSKIKGTEK